MRWTAAAAFGLEGLVKQDLKRLGMLRIAPLETGGVSFEGGPADGFRANLWLRTADRIFLTLDEFKALSFDALFEGVRAIPWEDYLPEDASFPVRAQCARSRLMSPSDCQAIVKKAVADRLGARYGRLRMPETGAEFQICVSIHRDTARIDLNSSGDALSRRGYRTWNAEAPLRETLAAALVLSSPWRPRLPLYDPCCGGGTLLIEATFIALDRAPGLKRRFAMENWPFVPVRECTNARDEAQARFSEGWKRPLDIGGSDIDPDAIELAKRHLKQADLQGRIPVRVADLRQLPPRGDCGAYLVNPPYGERLGDLKCARAVARQLGALQARSPKWSLTAITADAGFEKAYGGRADRKRRFYNGRLECETLIFQGQERI